jgi:hypothetical protein
MANYNKATNFTAKDTLPTGNAGKIIKGTEIDNEFTAIASAITSKADSNSPSFTGTPTAPTASLGTNTTQIASTAFIKAAIDALLPTGVITMWSGAITSIPTGWYLCDGQNSTPDLRGKFIIGAGATAASVTGSAGASVTGSISGTTLTVSAVANGTIAVGDIVSHSSIVETATITGLGTGSGGTGTYTLTYTGSTASFTGSISGTTLTVTAVASGTIITGQVLTGNSATSGTTISSQLTGTTGGIGTYTVSISQTRASGDFTGTYTLASTTLSILSTVLRVTAVASGTLSVGQFLTGTGIAFSTTITAFGTGSGNTGTYTLSSAQYFASTTVSASAGTVTIGATGGSKDSIVVSHTHTLTGTTGSAGVHQHFIARNLEAGNEGSLTASNYMARRGSFGSDYNYDPASTSSEANIGLTSNAGAHTHSLSGTTATSGSSGANANLPPYYALAYIMKA